MNFLEFIKNVPATVAAWSQKTQIIVAACTAGTLMVATVGGVAVYQHNNLAKEVVEEIATETESESELEQVVVEEVTEVAPEVQATEIVAVPTFTTCKVSTDSLEKDLTLYIKGEDNKKISGEAFQIKLISPNDKKKIASAVNAIDDINELIEKASDEAASGATSVAEDSEAVAADEGDGMLILGEAPAGGGVIYLSSETGLELSEKETLLIEKEKLLEEYCNVLASVKGEVYSDDNSDGMIYISKINSGEYTACLIPTHEYEPKTFMVKANVKDKLEYKAVETIEDKTVTEAAAGDVQDKHEEIKVESVLKDTVEWVDSYVLEGKPTAASASPKFTDAVAATQKAVLRLAKTACICDTKCTAKNSACPVCKDDITKCQGCSCEEKCTDEHKNESCPKCKTDISKCKGKTAECNCTEHCVDQDHAKSDCAVCKKDYSKCKVKATATCTCTGAPKCTSAVRNESCEVCKTDPTKCEVEENSSEPSSETPICSCETACEEGSPNTECAVCKEHPENCSKKAAGASEEGTPTARIIRNSSSKLATTPGTPASGEYTTGELTLTVSATTIYNTADGTRGTAEVKVTAPEGITAKLKINGAEVAGTTATIKASDYKSGTVSVIATASEPKDKEITDPKEVATATIQINVVSAETELKDASGNTLYTEAECQNVAKVGNYKNGASFYSKTGSTEKTYYGWQTINGIRYYFNKDGQKVTGEQVILGNKYNFGTDGALLTSGFGIDVSKWQGNIDWAQAKSAVSFAIIRAGIRGTTGALSVDSYAGTNIKNAKANGVKVGLYFYSRAQNEVQAVEEASLAVSIANQYGGISLPIYIDMEDSTQANLSTAQRDAIVHAFCQTVKNAGYSAGIYANKNWLSTKLTPSGYTGYSIWCAQYAASCSYTGRYDIWQYSSKGSIPGIKGDVDLNQSFF